MYEGHTGYYQDRGVSPGVSPLLPRSLEPENQGMEDDGLQERDTDCDFGSQKK